MSKMMRHVFYKGQLYLQYDADKLSFDEVQNIRDGLPVGSYVYNTWDDVWYVINGPTHASQRDPLDVPLEYRTQLLLLT